MEDAFQSRRRIILGVERLLFRHHADPLLDVVAFYCFVNHGDCIIRITDHAFSLGVKGQLFAAQNVPTGTRAVGLEITGGAELGPLNILTLTKFTNRFGHSGSQRLESIREVRTLCNTAGVLRIDIQLSLIHI